ncbi:hypothetical protein L7F22_028792 [Adiantum nelumboides]|nr:hypothetical protein [Adiantum nelumboides]
MEPGCQFVWMTDDQSMNKWLQEAVAQPNYNDLKLLNGYDLSNGRIAKVLKGGLRQYLSGISENPKVRGSLGRTIEEVICQARKMPRNSQEEARKDKEKPRSGQEKARKARTKKKPRRGQERTIEEVVCQARKMPRRGEDSQGQEGQRKAKKWSSNAMLVRGRQQSRGNHGSSDQNKSKSKERSKFKSGKDVECYHCHKKGHVKKDCYKWKNKQEKKNKDDKGKEKVSDLANNVKIEELNALIFDSDGDVLYTSSLSTVILVASNGSYEQDLIVDSGESFHVTPHKEWFSSYEGRHRIVHLGNSYACDIIGAGDIKMSLPNGSQFTLTNVRHVPKLTKSLILTGGCRFCETYRYYDLPFCPSAQVTEKQEALGEVLNGDRLVYASYQLNFLDEKVSELLCKKRLSKEEVKIFRDAVKQDYYFQMYYDDLPIWGFIGRIDDQELKYLLSTHLHFEVLYNQDRVIEISVAADPAYVVDILSSSIQSGFLATILMRVLENDFIKYSRDEEAPEDQEESGWKYIHGDVFRYPPHKSLFCAVLGSGTQLLALAIFIFMLALVGVFYPYNRGALYTALVVIYALTSGIAGYSAASFFRQLEGTNWVQLISQVLDTVLQSAHICHNSLKISIAIATSTSSSVSTIVLTVIGTGSLWLLNTGWY